MTIPEPLPPEKLYRVCDPAALGFKTTDDISDFDEILGQPRAVEAMRFGIDIRRQGYNIFVLGPQGAGRYTLIGEFLRRTAAAEPKPDDWCYIFNFTEPHKPKALRLPPGQGLPFRAAMAQLVDDLRASIPAAFEAEEHQARRNLIESELKERHEQAFQALRHDAQRKGLALGQSPTGFVFVPMRHGKAIPPEVFNALEHAEREAITAAMREMEERLESLLRQSQTWQKDSIEKLRALNQQLAQRVVDHHIGPLKAEFAAFPDVLAYLNAVRDDLIKNVLRFLRAAAGGGPQAMGIISVEGIGDEDPAPFRRYQVNVIVHNGMTPGAPVVYEDLPSVPSLIGRVEHAAQFGQLVTDFTLIKAGSLHKANGGYLIVDARKVLLQPFAYEELKRALQSRQIKIESLSQRLGYAPISTLEPEPIPLETKVVLVGEPILYYLLSAYDPEFAELFKVQAEMSDRMDNAPEALLSYARLIAKLVRREKLRPFTAAAVARVLEHSARMVEDSDKLSARFAYVLDLLREADYWAGEAGTSHAAVAHVEAAHVEQAIAARIRRADRIREAMQEQIVRGHVLIDTAGAKAGQVNGLSVLQLGNFTFGKPSRISARVRMGRGEVVDIERRVELGGPLHTKGVMILAGYLGAKFASDRPLALSATLVFEQSYAGVDGDSASSAELYALLSALAEIPIKQNFAVTGSVNQFGQVQAIGGVNEKIEGFFDVCAARGMKGGEGVLIPASNVVNLMLRKDVVEAVRAGRFRIYPVTTVDEGIEILTGVAAGAAGADGAYPPGTVNASVAARLEALAEAARRFTMRGAVSDGNGEGEGEKKK
ncbi:MAG TPA: ATP-binding protein [Alphaproteobacteria bacterium]|jgi:lon-related putative ATP-dependent protease